MTCTEMTIYHADFEKLLQISGSVSVPNCAYPEQVNYTIVIKKLHSYFILEEQKRFNFISSLIPNRYSLNVNKYQVHTSFNGSEEMQQKRIFGSSFLCVKQFHSHQKFTNTFAVKATTTFLGVNLQIVIIVVIGLFRRNCHFFFQFCVSF